MKEQAIAILEGVIANKDMVHFPTTEQKRAASAMALQVRGYKPTNPSCIACALLIVNIVREVADLPPIGGEASEGLRARRLQMCRGVAEYGSDACEHLAWPGLNCSQCGCFVDVKSAFKRLGCPIGRWPMR